MTSRDHSAAKPQSTRRADIPVRTKPERHGCLGVFQTLNAFGGRCGQECPRAAGPTWAAGARHIPILLAVFLCGCFQTKDELTLEADGSGKVRLETRTGIPTEWLGNLGMGARLGGEEMIIYPPISHSEAKKYFPGRDFTVSVKEEKAGESDRLLVIEASFKDVNALLASPYAHAHALTLKVENGKLTFKAISAMEAAARFAEIKDDSGMLGLEMAGLPGLQKRKGELRSEFRVTLPNPATAANGTRDGRTVTWIEERAKYTNGTDFAQQLGAVLEATCSADGVKMSPVSAVRLARTPFNELQAGPTGGSGSAPDLKKVVAEAKFVPYALQVTRTLDLSGEGGSSENQARLMGALVLPRELAPQKWGEAKLTEVVDAKGNSLKLEAQRSFGFDETRFRTAEGDEEDQEGKAESAEEHRSVTLRFQSPDWNVKEIARIKGSVDLQYRGGSQHIVKLTNAVPAKWIKDVSGGMDIDFDGNSRPLSHPALPELGLALNVQMGMAQGGLTMLMLQVSGAKAVLSDVQIYDAVGHPWPTFVQQQGLGEEGSCSITVAGRPVPPLSLALVASGVGAKVEVPILVEKIRLDRK